MAPVLQFSHRLKLIIQHLKKTDADVIGLCGLDAENGKYHENHLALFAEIDKIGYGWKYRANKSDEH